MSISHDPIAELDEAVCVIDHGWGRHIHKTAKIGDYTILSPNIFIGANVVIGDKCFIGPGSCIGQPGFGYEREEGEQEYQYRHHLEGVIIGDNVHIGANACIDGGRHRPTKIGNGTKIDNLVHIAHNVEIGENCLIIALSMIAGSCEIGDGCIVSPAAALRDWCKVGDEAHIGMGAVVVKRAVPAGETWAGVPAVKLS